LLGCENCHVFRNIFPTELSYDVVISSVQGIKAGELYERESCFSLIIPCADDQDRSRREIRYRYEEACFKI